MRVLNVAALFVPVAAQFGIFDQLFQQQHRQQQQQQHMQQQQYEEYLNPVEKAFYESQCDRYLCEDTILCVDSPADCPCPFANSQLKCRLGDSDDFVCISQPTTPDGPDCEYVNALLGST